MSEPCMLCDAMADRERHVYDEGGWFAYALADVPGWIMLGTKQHAVGTWALSDEDVVGLGPAIRAISDAVKETTGAHRVHVVYMGQHALHVHFGVFPRGEGDPPLLDNGPMVEAVANAADPAEARAIADRIRERLTRA